jgi:hypothetical protein
MLVNIKRRSVLGSNLPHRSQILTRREVAPEKQAGTGARPGVLHTKKFCSPPVASDLIAPVPAGKAATP